MLSVALASGVASTAAVAQEQPAMAGTVKRVTGTPMAVSARGERALEVGSPVYAGDRLVTREASAAGLTLLDGTQMTVGPNAAVAVKDFRFDWTTQQGSLVVDITRGALRMISGLVARNNPTAVAVNTPTATIGIRGTDFLVDVGEPVSQ